MAIVTESRNATLDDLQRLLVEQQAAKVDVVAPAMSIRSEGGVLRIEGALTETVPDPELGFREQRTAGLFLPTAICDDGISEKLGIHRAYLRKMREQRPDLYDANVNGWLHGYQPQALDNLIHGELTPVPPDGRKFLARCFSDPDGGVGVARAFLSDGFGFIDHLDVLTASLEGIMQAGVDTKITACDLTERRMYLRVEAPQVRALAPKLLAGYRNPFSDPSVDRLRQVGGWGRLQEAARRQGHSAYDAEDAPVVFAGFEVSNSETGGGAATIAPMLIVQWCRNGATIQADAFRKVHLGSRLEQGVVRWTEDTLRKNLDLVVAQARDAVTTFLDEDYLQMKVDAVEAKAERPVADAAETVEVVGKQLGFSDERRAAVLDMFIRGGQMTAGGVFNAVTAAAQTVGDADEAHAMEAAAVRALELAAK